MPSHQGLQPPLKVRGWALREFRKERILSFWQWSDCGHSPWWTPRKLRMWKHRILAPDSWGADQRNDFSEPRLLYLPIHSKTLHSLSWDIWFSLSDNNHCSNYLVFVANLLYILGLPLASLEQPLRVIWGTASWAAVLILPQIKLNSQCSGCASFFSWHLRQEHSPSLTITMNHCSWHLTLQNRF